MLWVQNGLCQHVPLDSIPGYWQAGDCDCDSLHLTISDILALYYRLLGDHNLGRFVESTIDTISIPAILTYPGQVIQVPIYLDSGLMLRGIQFYLLYNPDIIEIDGFEWEEGLSSQDCSIAGFGNLSDYTLFLSSMVINGAIGHLNIHVREDVTPPAETFISFSDEPSYAQYTGLSTSDSSAIPPEPRVKFIHPIRIDGRISIVNTGITDETAVEEGRVQLFIYANPANLSFRIEFHVPSAGRYSLDIFNMLGQKVSNLSEGINSPGRKSVVWGARGLTSGVYFCRLITETDRATAKVTLLK
jgi:hypothetical protein